MRSILSFVLVPVVGCVATQPGRSPAMQSGPHQEASSRRQIRIELLALDLATCGRCTRTEKNLDAALRSVADLLRESEVEVRIEKHVITSAAEAERHHLVSSPTIRVGGTDIALDLRETPCEDCGEICGCEGGVSCRVWRWQGKEYLEAPKAMIVDAILKAYGENERAHEPSPPYRMPENLRAYFRPKKAAVARQPCCDQDSCCQTSS